MRGAGGNCGASGSSVRVAGFVGIIRVHALQPAGRIVQSLKLRRQATRTRDCGINAGCPRRSIFA